MMIEKVRLIIDLIIGVVNKVVDYIFYQNKKQIEADIKASAEQQEAQTYEQQVKAEIDKLLDGRPYADRPKIVQSRARSTLQRFRNWRNRAGK